MPPRVFLTAEWRQLAMVNFAVDPALVLPYVPQGTELDDWNGQTFVSVVGFLFSNTRVLGTAIPLHRDFEEVNLRIYVRREVHGEMRRAVTFIREIVPRAAIAWIARWVYNEPYVALPMQHVVSSVDGETSSAEYRWRLGREWSHVGVDARGAWRPLVAGSLEEFITEHYWGYTRQRDGRTIEYRVEHPRWRVRDVSEAAVVGDLRPLYGERLASIVTGAPTSAFLADGSAVVVRAPVRLPGDVPVGA